MTDLEKLIKENINELANEILKSLNEKQKQINDSKENALSKAIDELEKEQEEISDNDDRHLINLGKKSKSKLTNDVLDKMTKKDKEEFLAKSEKKNLKTIQQIKEKLKTAMRKDPQKNRYKTITRNVLNQVKQTFDINESNYSDFDPEYDQELLTQLKSLFNQIRSTKKKTFSNRGKKVIVNRFLQAKYGNRKDIFQTKKATNELTFNFVVDQSGSMCGNTRKVGKLVKTFFKAVEDINEIKINVIGYETGSLNIVMNNPNELNRICYSGGSTPTGQAMAYAQDIIKKQSGKNVLVLVTDGIPDGIGSYVSVEKFIRFIVEDLKDNNNVDSFGIMIGSYAFEEFSQMFGKNFTEFSNIDSANDELIKIFKMFIDEYLRTC